MDQISCPKCKCAMDRWESLGVLLDHCNSCKGLWFDEGELTKHFANSGSVISEHDLAGVRDTPLSCPRCSPKLLSVARFATVEVDTCGQCHGIFLDLGEVHELLGVVHRSRAEGEASTSGFDNFALGLFIGANLHKR